MRILWVLLMIAGVVVFGLAAAVLWFAILSGRMFGPLPVGLAVLSLMATGACAAGIFMKPREFKEAVRPIGPEPERAAWLDQLGKDPRNDA